MKDEAEAILKDALPILNNATKALDTLNRNDISEIKQNNNPHALVKFSLESVAILLDEKPDWDNIKKMLADPNYLSRMQKLDVYNLPKPVQSKIKAKIASNPSFNPKELKKINQACCSICEWCLAVSKFQTVWKHISEKKKIV